MQDNKAVGREEAQKIAAFNLGVAEAIKVKILFHFSYRSFFFFQTLFDLLFLSTMFMSQL